MLPLTIPEIYIPAKEYYNEEENQFYNTPEIKVKETTLQLEHSLISLKKWEQKWHKPFLGKGGESDNKTGEEIIDYIKCMTINNVDPNIYIGLTNEMVETVIQYIKDPMSATWFSDDSKVGAAKNKSETITAEIIYYWMISLNIPVEFEKWHLNTLLTLIKVVNLKSQPSKKMTAKEAAAQRKAMNEARRAKMHSKG